MYNETQKRAFVKAVYNNPRSEVYTISLFDMMEPYETASNTDVSLMGRDTLQKMIDDFEDKDVGANKLTLFVISTIVQYITWLKKNNFPVSSAINSISSVRIEDIKYRMVFSVEGLIDILDDKAYNFYLPTLNSVNLIYRAYLLMGFMGIPESEIYSITADDVNLSEMQIIVNNKRYDIPRAAFFEFYQVCTQNEFLFGGDYQSSIRARSDEKSILRASKNSTVSCDAMRSTISKRFLVSEDLIAENPNKRWTEITYSRLVISGLFYRAYQKELKGGEANFIDYFENSPEFKSNAIKMSRYNKEYKATYDLWKIAFGKLNL